MNFHHKLKLTKSFC